MKANVLKSLKIICMLWRSYFLSCMIQHQQPWFSAASMNAQEMTARVCMVEPEEQLSTRAAAAATWRSVEHQSYNMASTFLQDGDPQRGRWSVTKHGACHLEPKIPSGGGQKRNTRLSYAGIWCCFGFFLLFHAHFSYLNSSLVSPTFPFSVHMWVFTHAYHFKDKFLNFQGMGPNGSSILVKLIYHQDQSKSLLQDIFLGGFPETCFSSPCSWGGRSFPISVVSCFRHCSCAEYGLKPRILMELLCHWRFLCPVWYFPLVSPRFLNFFSFFVFFFWYYH